LKLSLFYFTPEDGSFAVKNIETNVNFVVRVQFAAAKALEKSMLLWNQRLYGFFMKHPPEPEEKNR